jgi:putative redox protein
MKHEITSTWKSEMHFSSEVNGHQVEMDAGDLVGVNNHGPRPKPLLLASLAGCTGMDIVSLLKKMRVEADNFQIRVEGELTEDHPKYYHKIHVTYIFKGTNLDQQKIKKAVDLSQEKYCGVSAMLRKAAEITYEIVYQ